MQNQRGAPTIVPVSGKRRNLSRWNMFVNSVFGLALLMCTLPVAVNAKRTRGYFKLSGANTEHILSSFAVAPAGGRLTLRVGSDEMYDNEKHLKFHIFRDDVWKQYKKFTLCTEKADIAIKSIDLKFIFKGDGPLAPKGGKWQAVKTVMLADPNSEADKIDVPHFYYFVVDDCSLEIYDHDSTVPELYFEINTWNYYGSVQKRRTTQLGADENWLMDVHELTTVVSGGILAWLAMIVLARLARKKSNNTVHASVLWITIAAALDMTSSICQLMHLEIYHYNGNGNPLLDALSTHLEVACDSLLMLFLLSLGAGWTLPSDVVGIKPTAGSMMADMASPLAALTKFSKTGFAEVGFLLFNAILAQWGRLYNDRYDAYHDYAHLPGRITIFLRTALGLFFLGTTLNTRIQCRVGPLRMFYFVLALVGFLWFEAMPAVTFVCNWMLPLHWRRPAVYLASSILQESCLVGLGWLVTSHYTSYHQYSHMSNNEGPSLTETLSSPSGETTHDWKVFGKAKVRLD